MINIGNTLIRPNLENFLSKTIAHALKKPLETGYWKRRTQEISKYLHGSEQLCSNSSNELIVSLTSYGKRLSTAHLAIASIMDQTVPPDQVILYLDCETSPKELPKSLLELSERGVKIVFGVPNIYGHKKYYWSLQDYRSSSVVTIDDDLIYPRDTLENLLKGARLHPGSIIARRTHLVVFDCNRELLPYTNWIYEYQGACRQSQKSFLTSGGGTLFPPFIFPMTGFDMDAIRRCALKADDVWLNCALRSADIPVYRTHVGLFLYQEIDGTQKEALCDYNVIGGGNDRAMALTMNHFGLSASDFGY